jgi:Xaa-Pro aminopeptidase
MTLIWKKWRRAIMTNIPKSEFQTRIENLRNIMRQDAIDLFLVYGDEYRREHLRYVSNYWPIFERGMLVVGLSGDPVLLVAPECFHYAKEASIWSDLRIVAEMEVAYVADKIEYSAGNIYTTLEAVFKDVLQGKNPNKVKVCGFDAMSVITLDAIKRAANDAQVLNGDPVIYGMRLIKSPLEIQALRKAWQVCDQGYKAILDRDLVGLTEIQAAALGEKAARDAGAEQIVFSIFAAGSRTDTVVGRATERIIQKGEIVMACMAVQYDGYIASDEWPMVAGGHPTPDQFALMRHLIIAEDLGIKMMKNGVVAGQVVACIRDYFASNGLTKYDLYPPIHGNGLAEAESPYPDEHTTYPFKSGMGVNFDVSLFGLPGVGSNRVEEGFIVDSSGLIVLSELISSLRADFLKKFA